MIAHPADVKACLERVLALMADRDKINEDIAQALDDFKEKGVVAKGIRRVATLQRMDPKKRRSDEEMIADYEAAFAELSRAAAIVSGGGSYEEAQQATGLSRATVARAAATVRRVSNGKEKETPHDPQTGEITEDALNQTNNAAGTMPVAEQSCGGGEMPEDPPALAKRPPLAAGASDASVRPCLGEVGLAADPQDAIESRSPVTETSDSAASVQGVEPVEPKGNSGFAGERDPESTIAPTVSLGAVASASERVANTELDSLDIPPFLDRRPA